MPDQVPLGPPALRMLHLVQRLLHPILADSLQSGVKRRLYGLGPEPLRDGEHRHRMTPAAELLPTGDLGSHMLQAPRQTRKNHSRAKYRFGRGDTIRTLNYQTAGRLDG